MSGMRNYRIVLADDHVMFRQSLKAMLERMGVEVAGEAADGGKALRLVHEIIPEIAVLDLSMPVMSGLEVVRKLASFTPKVRTILLTMHTEDSYVSEALRVGVGGYVLKGQAVAELRGSRTIISGIWMFAGYPPFKSGLGAGGIAFRPKDKHS